MNTEWKEAQARLLQEGRLEEMDLNAMLEMLFEMVRSDKNSVVGLARVVMMRLLKLKYQPEKQTRSWFSSIVANRASLNDLIDDQKTLRLHLDRSINKIYADSIRWATMETGLPAGTFPPQSPFDSEDLLNNDFFAGAKL